MKFIENKWYNISSFAKKFLKEHNYLLIRRVHFDDGESSDWIGFGFNIFDTFKEVKKKS